MSRIGKQPIPIPSGVVVTIEGRRVSVSGRLGAMTYELPSVIQARLEGEEVHIQPIRTGRETPRFWGLARAIVANMIHGVTDGYQKRLIMEGVGYRPILEGKDLVLHVGFSHPVRVSPPDGIQFGIEKNTIIVSGIDKQRVGDITASLRKIRKPEPYKGSGIRYEGEIIRRKAGKKAATGTA
ncbi:MAG: 50S ribosomal protein L6 [Parcubacteria group bacterium]|nr:50S ribosomal protein L6 [Parcubacteria group bacterium]